tara:strand:+ start:882 stop:1289 length:408 start_codon:yes stop_codon:yes gene_type:complete
MKVTKKYLKQLIKEELAAIEEAGEMMSDVEPVSGAVSQTMAPESQLMSLDAKEEVEDALRRIQYTVDALQTQLDDPEQRLGGTTSFVTNMAQLVRRLRGDADDIYNAVSKAQAGVKTGAGQAGYGTREDHITTGL